MKIQIIKRSQNKLSWINSRINEVVEIVGERSADHEQNITGSAEYVASVETGITTGFIGAIEKDCAKVVEVGTERLTVGDLWPNDLVLIRGEVATVGMTNGAKVEITYQGGRTETVNPKNIKIVGVA